MTPCLSYTAVLLLATAATAAEPRKQWVVDARHGNDGNAGTGVGAAFRTLGRAKSALRAWRRAHASDIVNRQGPGRTTGATVDDDTRGEELHVVLREGVYPSLRLSESDGGRPGSEVVWAA